MASDDDVAKYVAPAPDVTLDEPTPVIKYVASAPAVFLSVPVQVIEHVAPAPADTYATPAPVIDQVTPSPVIEHIAPAPSVTHVTPSQQLPPAFTMTAVAIGVNLDTTGFLGEFAAPVYNQIGQEQIVAEETTQSVVSSPVCAGDTGFDTLWGRHCEVVRVGDRHCEGETYSLLQARWQARMCPRPLEVTILSAGSPRRFSNTGHRRVLILAAIGSTSSAVFWPRSGRGLWVLPCQRSDLGGGLTSSDSFSWVPAGCALIAYVKQSADIPALLVCRPRLICRVRCPSLQVNWRAALAQLLRGD